MPVAAALAEVVAVALDEVAVVPLVEVGVGPGSVPVPQPMTKSKEHVAAPKTVHFNTVRIL